MQKSPCGSQLPPWELAGTPPLPERGVGALYYLAALEKWGRPDLVQKWRALKEAIKTGPAAPESVVAVEHLLFENAAAAADFRDIRTEQARRVFRVQQQQRIAAIQNLAARRRAAASVALDALEVEFRARWRDGEFVCFGFDSVRQIRDLIQTSLSYNINLTREHPAARAADGRAYQEVRFYRVVDAETAAPALAGDRERPAASPEAVAALMDVAPSAAIAAASTPSPPVSPPLFVSTRGEPPVSGKKKSVWEAAKRLGPPGDKRGDRNRYAQQLAGETGVGFETVRNYVTKSGGDGLAYYIAGLCPRDVPEAGSSQMGQDSW